MKTIIIKDLLKQNKTGIYVFAGDQADEIFKKKYTKLTPLFYTDNLLTNKSNMIDAVEEKHPEFEEFTVVDIDRNGDMDVVIY